MKKPHRRATHGFHSSCLKKDHQTVQVQQKEQEQATEMAGEEEATGVQGSTVVQGYQLFVRLVRLVVRSIGAYL